MGKARVTPLKTVTVPRLELTAALVSARISRLLQRELQYENVSHTFWTDSTVVLGYINNDSRRFHVFVANRVQEIRDCTSPEQWNHVKTDENPADFASRGLTAKELTQNSAWFSGPDFLRNLDVPTNQLTHVEPDVNDPEVKQACTFASQVKVKDSFDLERLDYFSDWTKARRAIAVGLKFKAALKERTRPSMSSCSDETPKAQRSTNKLVYRPVTVKEIEDAELEIVRKIQQNCYAKEIEILTQMASQESKETGTKSETENIGLSHKSPIYKLSPFIDSANILRVGGRIAMAEIDDDLKHPIILPRNHRMTRLIVQHFHVLAEHQGRGITSNLIRSNGFWIVGCSKMVKACIAKCISCRKYRAGTLQQKMSNLPRERMEQAPPFTYCGVDYFGPFEITEGRKRQKRYGVLFTCMSSRAIHVETASSLSSDSFICALRRFIAIRGPIRQLRSDRGTNLVGGERELRDAMQEMDQEKVRHFLMTKECDYFVYKTNVPNASHMGGVWERQIRTVRSVLVLLMRQLGAQLNDESLRTFMHEAAAIVNCRPLTTDNLNDPLSLQPLSPSNLLTMKTSVILPPPGEFTASDTYSRKQWRRVQYLANEFWNRWKKEYLQNLQQRSKWNRSRRNLEVGDIVILKDDQLPRNKWRLARVCEVFPSSDNLVRKVSLQLANSSLDSKGKPTQPATKLERPIHKLVLLLENSDDKEQ